MDLTDKNLPVSIIVPLNILKDNEDSFSNTVIMLKRLINEGHLFLY